MVFYAAAAAVVAVAAHYYGSYDAVADDPAAVVAVYQHEYCGMTYVGKEHGVAVRG